MSRRNYSFPLGKIGVREEKIMKPSAFQELVPLPLAEAFSRFKSTFFVARDFKEDYGLLEDIFVREEGILKEECVFLLQNDASRIILKNIDKPASLLEAQTSAPSFLKEFLKIYFAILNTALFLRIKTYTLRSDYYDYPRSEELLKELDEESFLVAGEIIKKFYEQIKSILAGKENYLLEFLQEKYIVDFLQERKKKLLGEEIVFWYYFAKRLNLRVGKFLILGKLHNLKEVQLKRIVEVVYG